MKIKSLKGMLILSLCVWGATGAVAFIAGQKYAQGLVASAVQASKQSAFAKTPAGKEFADIHVKESPPPSLNDLINGKGKPGAGDLARFVAGLTAEDCARVAEELKTMPPGAKRDTILAAVVEGWAKKNPSDFLTHTDKLTNPKAKEQGIAAALQALAMQDPTAALDWYKSNPGMMSNQAARYSAIIEGMAMANPTAAFNLINGMPDTDPNKLAAFTSMFKGIANQGDFNDAVALMAQVPDGQLKNQAMRDMMSQWAANSPEDAAKYVATLMNQPAQPGQFGGRGNQPANYLNMIAASWAGSDPAAAAAWAAQVDAQLLAAANDPNNPQAGNRGGRGGRANVLATTVGEWAAQDLDGAATFLNSMPASPNKDQAINNFVMSAMSQDPEGSLGWVKTMTNANMQQRLTTEVGMQLLRQDPNTFYATPQLTDQQRQQIIAFSQNNFNGNNGFAQPGQGRRGQNNVVNGQQPATGFNNFQNGNQPGNNRRGNRGGGGGGGGGGG